MNIFKCERLKTLEEIILRVDAMSRGAGNFGKGGIVDLILGDHGFVFRHRTKRRVARLANGMHRDTVVVEFNALDEDIPALIKINDPDDYLEVAAAITNWFCNEEGELFTCRKNGRIEAFKVIRVDGNTKLVKAE
ncbi:hypothetical protein [Pseudomonas phage D6]|nr:hypothetical protein [Pseudomonas phage D6]